MIVDLTTQQEQLGVKDAKSNLFRVLDGALTNAVTLGVVTGVTWVCLVCAHAFDHRVPVLNVYAIIWLSFAVCVSATWIRWAILTDERHSRRKR